MAAADCLTLSMQCVQEIARQVAEPPERILSARQCENLSLGLLEVIGSIQELVSSCEASAVVAFQPALEEFQRIVEEARMLVQDCSRADWLKASVFQIRNEEAFREILLKVGLCYNVIYEQAKTISLASGRVLKVEDLRSLPPSDSTFRPALEEDVREDQQTLQERLEEVTQSAKDSKDVILARYLLKRLKTLDLSEKFSYEDTCIMYDASTLDVSDTDLEQTWDSSFKVLHYSTFSIVYKTKWLELNAAKKVWVIKDDDESFAEQKDQFRREAELLASVAHPNIVKFFCCGIRAEGHRKHECFMGMELMEKSLGDLIWERRKDGQPFPMQVALDIILQIARGMLYLHDLEIAHRDFKPQNVGVLSSPNGPNDFFCVKLLDFGLSKTKVQVSKSNTVSNANTGTTKYRAPEAFKDAKRANIKQKVKWFRADVYSFAVTCYQILTLQEPYASIGNTALYKKLKDGTRPPRPAGCPETLFKLMEECWAGDFNARPNFSSICERLEKFKHDLLLQGLRGENVVASSSSSAYIETMLKQRSELRKHLAKVVKDEGATSEVDEGDISEGDDGTISEGGDGAVSEGADEMEYASQRINGRTQSWKVKEAGKQPLRIGLSTVRRGADQGCQGEEYPNSDKSDEVVDHFKTNGEKRSDEALPTVSDEALRLLAQASKDVLKQALPVCRRRLIAQASKDDLKEKLQAIFSGLTVISMLAGPALSKVIFRG